MIILKEKIKTSFDKCAPGYDTGTSVQKHMAGMLVNAIREDGVKFSNVLDVGCGTGYVLEKMGTDTDKINGVCPHFYAGDISFSMLKCAKNKLSDKNCSYVQLDAMHLPFGRHKFDLVVSNAAYQWFGNLKSALKEVRRVMKPAGAFYFTIFNSNTLWQLQEACKETKIITPVSSNFVNKETLLSGLKKSGLTITRFEILNYDKYYKDLWDLLKSLKKIGAGLSGNRNAAGLGWRKILRKANELYAQKFGYKKGIVATYEAFLISASPLSP